MQYVNISRSVDTMLHFAIGILLFLFKCILIVFVIFVILLMTIIILFKLFYEFRAGVCKCTNKLHGKVILVTGGNSGIGLETARDLARRGATVVIACRNADKSAKAVADIIETTGNKHVEFRYLDLSLFSSIRKFVEDFNKSYNHLDILVNNAGCAGLKKRVTEDNIDIVMQVNYFGPFLLTNLLMDKLVASKPSRIIIVSSYLHNFAQVTVDNIDGHSTEHYMRLYCNSKLCDVLWTKALAKRLPDGVTVNSLHPGAVKTDIANRLTPVFRKITLAIVSLLFKTPVEGAQTTIHLCVSEQLNSVSGQYFKDCKLDNASKLTNDEEFVEEVWKKSLFLTNSSNSFPKCK